MGSFAVFPSAWSPELSRLGIEYLGEACPGSALSMISMYLPRVLFLDWCTYRCGIEGSRVLLLSCWGSNDQHIDNGEVVSILISVYNLFMISRMRLTIQWS